MSLKSFDNALDLVLSRSKPSFDIRQGNCIEVMQAMEPESVHLIVTDPPYGTDGMGSDWNSKSLSKRKKRAGVIGGLPTGMKFDPKQGEDLQKFFTKVSEQAIRVLYPGAFFLVFSSPRLSHRIAIAMEDVGFEIRDMYAWHYKNKSQAKAFSMDHFIERMKVSQTKKNSIIRKLSGRKTAQLRPQFEPIIVAQKPKTGTYVQNWLCWETGLVDIKNTRLNGHIPTTVMEVNKPEKDTYNSHLTVKPVKLIETLIKLFSKKGQVVLDPFLGSGTTLLATRNEERRGIGIEIDQSYIDIINQRLGVKND